MKNNLNVIAVFLLMMGGLLVSAAVMSPSQGAEKMGELLCVGGKWFRVGSFRFWQRKACVKRRQSPTEVPKSDDDTTTRRAPSTVDLDLILPSLEAGPTRLRPEYQPNYGYEPYWAEGDWVFDRDPIAKNATEYMCGVRCPKVYTEYGKVCGRNKHKVYETFVNYCQLKNKDCSNIERWSMIYKGECGNAFVIYNEDTRLIQERVKLYQEDFDRIANTTTTTIGWLKPELVNPNDSNAM